MPAVVYKQPSPIGPLLSGVAGAFAGAAEGDKYVEGVRQFDVQFEEGQRQFNADMKFRIDQLRQMRAENKLDREQQQRLQYLEQKWTSGENVLGREHEVGVQKRDITSKEKINTEQLRQSDVENKRNVGVQHRRITVEDDQFQAGYRQRNEDLKNNQFRLNTVGQIRLKYPNVQPGTPAYEAAKLEYLRTVAAPGTTTGQQGVDQLTAEERGAFGQQFDTLFQNYDQEVARQASEVQQLTTAQSLGEAEGQIKAQTAAQSGVLAQEADPTQHTSLKGLFLKGGGLNENTRDYGVNYSQEIVDGKYNPLYRYREQASDLDQLLTDAMLEYAAAPFDPITGRPGSATVVATRQLEDAHKMIDRMTGLPPELKMEYHQYVDEAFANGGTFIEASQAMAPTGATGKPAEAEAPVAPK